MLLRIFASLVFATAVVVPGLARSDALLQATAESLRPAKAVSLGQVPLLSGRLLADFYARRGYAPAWTDQKQIDGLLRLIDESDAEGFVPEDFHVGSVRALAALYPLDRFTPAQRIGADLQLSDALLRYVHHSRFGKIDPIAVNGSWNFRDPVPAEQLIADMDAALAAEDLVARAQSLFPRPYFYEDLKRALKHQIGTAHLKDLSAIPNGRNLALGDRDERVSLVRERLGLLGDYTAADSPEPALFDDGLRDAVVSFQRRIGMSPDGIVGPATVAALSQPFDEDKVERIRINLERMRWLYSDLPPDYVLVDVAGYMVHVVRDGKVNWSTRVVVGTPEQQTPMFRDQMEHLVFNPTWTVPPSIQEKMRGVSSRYKVVDRRTGRAVSGVNVSDHKRFRLVQAAGPGNALGRVKFMFPNGHAIYLHDTPSRGLFSHRTRAYSHGCVRVQDPLKLAEVILDEPAWDQSAIKRVVSSSRTRYVHLDEHLPVLLYYLTAFADENGDVSFRGDVYGRDRALGRALAGEASEARIKFEEPPAQPDPGAEGAPIQSPGAIPPAAPQLREPPDGVTVSAVHGVALPIDSTPAASVMHAGPEAAQSDGPSATKL